MSEKQLPARFLGDIELYEADEDDSHLVPRLKISGEERFTIITMLGQGVALGKVRDALKISADRFWSMLRANPKFMGRMQLIRQAMIEELTDEMLHISNSVADVQRAKLITDNIKWLASKRIPHVYGDKLHVEHTVVDLNSAINDAVKRSKNDIEVKKISSSSKPIDLTNDVVENSDEDEELKTLLS